MDKRIGAQYYTIRDYLRNIEDFDTACQKVSEMGYKIVQISGTPLKAKEMREVLDKYSLECKLTHRDFNDFKKDLDEIIDYNKTLGCDLCGIGGMPAAAREGHEELSTFINEANLVCEKLHEAGMYFGYHNHAFEFVKFDGKTLYERLVSETDPEKFDALYKKLEHYEQVTDRIELEIAKFLDQVKDGVISEESARRIQAMYKIISELESIGDSGFNIARILQRRNIHNMKFDEPMIKKLNYMTELLERGFEAMLFNLNKGYTQINDIANAQDVEQDINEYRNNLKEEHLLNLENKTYNYLTGVYYMDLVNECESVGDFMINISEAIMEIK